MIEYKLISAGLPQLLNEEINKHLEQGWSLYGNTFYSGNGDDSDQYCQAVIRNIMLPPYE